MTLTEEERQAARATDQRAADLLDRVDNMPPELLERLHGTVRYLRAVTGPAPGEPERGSAAGRPAEPEPAQGGPVRPEPVRPEPVQPEPADITAGPEVPWW